MEDNCIDELFNKIHQLESENQDFKKKLETLDRELENKAMKDTFKEIEKNIVENLDIKNQIEKADTEILENNNNNNTEEEIIKKIINFATYLKSNVDKLSGLREDMLSESKYNYDSKIEVLSALTKDKFSDINDKFVERVIKLDNSILFRIVAINVIEGYIKGVRLYDKNGLKVDTNYHLKTPSTLENIPLANVFNNTYIFSRSESAKILDEHLADTNSILKIYYELLGFDDDNDESSMIIDDNPLRRSRKNSVAKDLVPYKIIPDTIDITKYNLEINNNKILSVRNKDANVLIVFEAVLLRESEQSKGFVSTSSLKVFTSLYSKDIVNILHIHLNDTSEEIAVDSAFLERGHSVSEFKKFDLDYLGKKLNYKFLFKDYKLIKVFYNVAENFIDEPNFEEVRIKPGKIVKIINHDLFSNYFGKISNVPIGMLARKDKEVTNLERLKSSDVTKEGYCHERHLEELPGFITIDVNLTPDKAIVEKPIRISIPVCKVIPLTPKEEVIFEKILVKSEILEKKQTEEKLNILYKNFIEINQYVGDNNKLKALTLDEVKNMLEFTENSISDNEKVNFKSIFEESDENIEVNNKFIKI